MRLAALLAIACSTPEAPPELRAEPPDEAPRFAEGAALELTAEPAGDDGTRTVVLAWPAAEDDIGVVRYRVTRSGEELAVVEEPRARIERVVVTPMTVFEVVALDARGQESAPLALLWGESEPGRREAADSTAQVSVLRVLGAPSSESGGLADILRDHAVSTGPAQVRARGAVAIDDPVPVGRPGSFHASDVGNRLRQRAHAVRSCYEHELARDPSLRGDLRLALTIDPSGSVRARELERTIDAPIAMCSLRVVERSRFPRRSDGGPAEFTVTIRFSPAS